MKNKMDPRFAVFLSLLCRTNCNLIVSEASSLISFWDYCKRLVYIDFSFSEGVTRYRFKGQDDRTAMSISLEGFSLVLKTVLSDQKNCLAVRGAGQFFFSY